MPLHRCEAEAPVLSASMVCALGQVKESSAAQSHEADTSALSWEESLYIKHQLDGCRPSQGLNNLNVMTSDARVKTHLPESLTATTTVPPSAPVVAAAAAVTSSPNQTRSIPVLYW